jgi:hypothetical protein
MAKYDDLTDLLSGLGETGLSIKGAVLVKFGTILLAKPNAKSSEPPRGVSPVIHSALKSHPNIFEPKEILEQGEEETSGTKYGFFVKGPFFHYRVHLPTAKQKYRDMDSAEHFSVVSNGSMFAAYVEVEDVTVWSNIGHEFRELATKQIEKETGLKCPAIGPCPIHPNIVVVFCDDAEKRAAPSVKKYRHDDDILVVTSDNRPIAEIVLDLFFDYGLSLEQFYDLAVSRSDLLDASSEMESSFLTASASVDELLKTPSWRLWKTHVLSRQARVNVATVHQNLVALESGLLVYGSDRSRTLQSLRKDRDAALLLDYVRDITAPEIGVPSSLASALGFFEAELQLYGSVRSLLFASVLGAIVGSLFTGVLVHFLK